MMLAVAQCFTRRAVAVASMAIFGLPALALGNPTPLTVFGDSLSDVGNLDFASGGVLPGEAYFSGRFSNGPLYADLLGFGISHSLEGGNNFAIAGATTGASVVGFPGQLDSFSMAHPEGADPQGLYLVWFGANDVIDGYEGGDPDAAAMEIDVALSIFGQALSDLIELGARNVIVLNLPDLSHTPDALEFDDPAAAPLARSLTLQWNAGLDEIVSAQDSPGIVRIDVAALFEQILADPLAYGFTNLQDRAISTPGDDREFLFWDGVHPTTRVHQILAEQMQMALDILTPHSPTITGITHDPAGPRVSIEFDSQPKQRYIVEFSTSLTGGWRELVGDLVSQGEVTRFTDTIGVATADARAYYRVRCASGLGAEPVPPPAR
ncbi:MAG: SGNH/GDSL hydrolase family protein [Verrucomicrobiales bacterium]